MTICYFGDYDPTYNRTKVILEGLAAHNINVVHCQGKGKGVQLYRDLMGKHRALGGHYDVLVVGYGNARLLPVLARFISSKIIVWDPLYSLYDNWVFDRKLAKPRSLKAYFYWWIDWLGCAASTRILLDTNTNAKYFENTFRMPKYKFIRVLVGADTKIFYPREHTEHSSLFEIEFHGKYIPVQGTDVLIEAAKLLEEEDIHITMIGGGQNFEKTKKLAEDLRVTNVTFLPFLPQTDVVEYIRNADVCIGLLGDVPRVVRAIPNKLYEAAAMARVSLNVDSSALREVFRPGIDTVGTVAGDPQSIAAAIRELKRNGNAEEMGNAAYETFCQKAVASLVISDFLAYIQAL